MFIVGLVWNCFGLNLGLFFGFFFPNKSVYLGVILVMCWFSFTYFFSTQFCLFWVYFGFISFFCLVVLPNQFCLFWRCFDLILGLFIWGFIFLFVCSPELILLTLVLFRVYSFDYLIYRTYSAYFGVILSYHWHTKKTRNQTITMNQNSTMNQNRTQSHKSWTQQQTQPKNKQGNKRTNKKSYCGHTRTKQYKNPEGCKTKVGEISMISLFRLYFVVIFWIP